MPDLIFDNLGTRENSTVTGNTVKRAFGTGGASGNSAHRRGVQVCNHDAAYALFVKLVAANASLPTITATDHDFKVQPGDTETFPVGSGVDLCILNSSDGSEICNNSCMKTVDHWVEVKDIIPPLPGGFRFAAKIRTSQPTEFTIGEYWGRTSLEAERKAEAAWTDFWNSRTGAE
jgi:hypothetical protein